MKVFLLILFVSLGADFTVFKAGYYLLNEDRPLKKTPVPAVDLLPRLPINADSLTELHQAIGADAGVFESEHFVLVHTTRLHVVRKLAARLEAVYRANMRFMREMQLTSRRPAHKLEVLVFGTYEQFRAYQQRMGYTNKEILGFFEQADNRSVFFDLNTYPPIDVWQTELANLCRTNWPERRKIKQKLINNTEALNATAIQHEAAHQIHFNIGVLPPDGDAPTWLSEGLAQMFELPFLQCGATLKLSTNRCRLHEFIELHNEPDQILPNLQRIITDDAHWLGGQDYSLGWALTNYLYIRKRQCFAGYLRWLTTQENPIANSSTTRRQDFERFFGPLDERFVADFQEYMHHLQTHHASKSD